MSLLISKRGQSIVEITLITPLLLIALYVPVDFGIALFTGHLTQNAVREAARIGVSTKDPFDSTAANAIGDEALANIPARLLSPTVTVRYYASGPSNCLQSVEVRAQGTYSFFWYHLIQIFGFPPPDPVTITRATQMRYEFHPASTTSTLCTLSFTVTRV